MKNEAPNVETVYTVTHEENQVRGEVRPTHRDGQWAVVLRDLDTDKVIFDVRLFPADHLHVAKAYARKIASCRHQGENVIDTICGMKVTTRVVRGVYARALPEPSAPHGSWWKSGDKRVWVPVPSNSPELLRALEEDDSASASH